MESQGVSGDRNPSNLRIKKTENESQCIFTSPQFGSQFPQTRSSEVDTLSHQIQQTLGMPQPLQCSNTQATTMPGTAHNVTSRQYTGHRSLSDTVEGFYSVEHGRELYSYPCLSERPQQCQERSGTCLRRWWYSWCGCTVCFCYCLRFEFAVFRYYRYLQFRRC